MTRKADTLRPFLRCAAVVLCSLALPLAAPVGALVLLLADIAARTLVAPQELATGAMTALVGAPLFIFIAARFFK